MSVNNTSAKFPNFTMTIPAEGPVSVPDSYEFVANEALEIDLSQLTFNGWLEFVSGVFIDNTLNTGFLYFTCSGTKQNFYFPPGYSGYVPLFLPNPPKVVVTSSENANVTFQWYNVPVFPLLLPGPGVSAPPTNITEVNSVALTGDFLPVQNEGGTLTEYTFALTGANDTLITAGQALHYFIMQNPIGNADVMINLAGNDATATGLTIIAGGYYESIGGIANDITISGTAAQSVTVFAG